jgi:hypothetical protein
MRSPLSTAHHAPMWGALCPLCGIRCIQAARPADVGSRHGSINLRYAPIGAAPSPPLSKRARRDTPNHAHTECHKEHENYVVLILRHRGGRAPRQPSEPAGKRRARFAVERMAPAMTLVQVARSRGPPVSHRHNQPRLHRPFKILEISLSTSRYERFDVV